ncbi:phosphoadenosine phosphosulfate reductase, partial [Enterococcus faecalis]|nr:phosphoadenosine phosphosulfate reductase [Enterococcus faecalis]
SHMTWEDYAVFLLESIGLYSKKLQDHYYRKITILIDHYREKHGIEVEDIPDVTKRKDWLKNEVLWHDWKGIARALEKNDFSLSTRQYSLTKKDESELYEL